MPVGHGNSATTETARLAWVIAGVMAALLPHLPHFPIWIPLTVAGASAWRLGLARAARKPPATWLRLLLAAIGFAGVLWAYGRLSGVDAGTALLAVMLSMKILETRVSRDRLIVVFISFFLIFAALLRNQAIWSIAYVIAGCFINAAALLQAARIGPPLPILQTARRAAATCVLALPVMIMLFIVFPRVPGPFWALPPSSSGAATGLSNTISPGDISRLGQNDAVAMRVRFEDDVPRPNERYWRGPVLTQFDGRTWTGAEPRRGRFRPPQARGLPGDAERGYRYEVSLEPHNQHWLLALETPREWPEKSLLTDRLQLISLEPVVQVRSYEAISAPATRVRTPEFPLTLKGLTRVPENLNPRTRAWATALWRQSANPHDYLARILRHFREAPFYYTLTPETLGRDSVDEFLFDTREGFCEHYASAFAVLARMAGIPSRVVAGYLGAEHNPLLDYWIVRQSDAHAWVEVRLDDAWVRYDPTGAVAPDRVDIGLDAAISGRERSTGRMLRSNRIFNGLVLSWDAVNAAWDRWVLGYGPTMQSNALRWLGVDEPELKHLAIATGAATMVCLALTGFVLSRRRRRWSDPVARAYTKFAKRIARVAREARRGEGPSDYAAAIAELRPDLAGDIERISREYVRLRYETTPGEEEVSAFRRMISGFRPTARGPR